jgi:hypothetical protein
MPLRKYTPKQIQFIRDNAGGRSREEMLDMFNRRFGLSVNKSQLKSIFDRHGIHNGTSRRFTPEEIQFIRDNIRENNGTELLEMFNRRFAIPITKNQLLTMCWNRKLYMHRKDVGTERVYHGYVFVRTTGYPRWKIKHRIVWEAANGPVPEGHAVIFADGNKTNFALENLLLVSQQELAVMNNRGFVFPDGDLSRAGKAVADLIMLIHDRERQIGVRRIRKDQKK